jgi:hypothetical protein
MEAKVNASRPVSLFGDGYVQRFNKESIIEKIYFCENLPQPPLPSGPEALWAGGQRGGIPPFCKGREGGI